jgi:hypothetical protein
MKIVSLTTAWRLFRTISIRRQRDNPQISTLRISVRSKLERTKTLRDTIGGSQMTPGKDSAGESITSGRTMGLAPEVLNQDRPFQLLAPGTNQAIKLRGLEVTKIGKQLQWG